VLVLDFLGCGILLLFSLFGTSVEAEYQIESGILGNTVVYPSIVISMADSGRGLVGKEGLRYRLGILSPQAEDQSK
jgi:hypothetical protein